MPRNQGLTHRQAEAITTPGRYPDGRSLYLVVSPRGKSWVFRYRAPGGKAREMGLGAFPDVTVAEARRAVADARDTLKEGRDPIGERDAKRRADIAAAAKLAAKGALTFGEYTVHVLPDLLADSANLKHRWAYARQLELHAAALNRMVLADIRTADVAACLKPIWRSLPETARRVRGRIERIMARAIVEGKHAGPNPGTWQNNLEHAGLGRDTNTRGNVKHMAAMPYEAMPDFMEELRARSSMSARALEFTILTAARTTEVVAAKWGEIDFAERLWTKPAEHMKGKQGHRKEHRVPLTDEAIALLKSLPHGKRNDPIFRNAKTGEQLSNWAMLECLKDLRPNVTVHGFRSSFSDYIGDRTEFDSRLVEFALAHRIENEVERAYRRGDAWERRRPVMEAWTAYLAGKSCNVVPLDRSRGARAAGATTPAAS